MDFTDPELGVGSSTVGDFWRWAYSSLADNAQRGVFAEFLVGLTLDVLHEPRVEWDAADLRFQGRLIEVKSSADNQTWRQHRPSTIRFDVAKKTSWNAQTNEYASSAGRAADIYVFCHCRGAATPAQVVEVDRWDFYALATLTINEQLGDQKSVGLRRLHQLAAPVTHPDLRSAVEAIVGSRIEDSPSAPVDRAT